jgi:type I restriction enzyme S subunit
MNRIIQVKDIVELNQATYKKDEFPETVKYLDTSSLTKNRIQDFQLLNTKTDIIPSRAQRKVRENTILYSTVRPNQEHFGIIERPLDNIIVSTGFTTLDIIDKEISPKYFYYLLTQPHITEYLHTIATNSVSAYPSISPNDIGNLKFRVPDLSTQQKIASVLSALDSKIELNNRINAELEAMAKTLYDYWFVQFNFPFDFAKGKPDKNGKPYKSSGGKMVWNEALKREIPEGWEVKKIKDLAKTGSGGTPLSTKTEYYENGNIPWINSGEVNSSFIIEAKNFITEDGLNNSSAKIYPKGTILMAMYGATAGQVSLMNIDACTNQAICAIIPNDKKITHYLKFALHQLYQYLINLSSGSARDNLSQEKIKELLFAIPEEIILQRYFDLTNQYFDKILINLKENQQLSELRDWLLPMLMNGQVKVS